MTSTSGSGARSHAHSLRVDVIVTSQRTVLESVRVGTSSSTLGTLEDVEDGTRDTVLTVLELVGRVEVLSLVVALAEGTRHRLLLVRLLERLLPQELLQLFPRLRTLQDLI